jgi:response regulator RpfG family c-di-GMP phosphodiesterase
MQRIPVRLPRITASIEPPPLNAKILLVEDVEEVRTSVARMLSRRYDVTTAADAREAIETIGLKGPFPVVVSDYSMPDMDGLALLHEVHAHAPGTAGILLTGVADLELATAAIREGGVFRFLSKPCGFEAMVSAIDDALASSARFESQALELECTKFGKAAFADFNDRLEDSLARQTHALVKLHEFTEELCAAGSLREIVRHAAKATSAVLVGRGVHVQVWDPDSGNGGVDGGAGPEMSSDLFTQDLVTRDGKLGEIVVDRCAGERRGLSMFERSLLASIAASTAVAARHEFRRRERDHAQRAAIVALARLAEQRDNETGKHLERVAAYCRLLAECLRSDGLHKDVITDAWVVDLERSSALHDIGKVGIPDSILLKPGKLTPEEWVIMKTHADLGRRTIESVLRETGQQDFLVMGRDIAWCHHEKWDGSGYPRGLSGTQIPLAARILAMADVYDALTSVRPYKQAWPHEEALAWVRERGGLHFDPDVVAAFVKCAGRADVIRHELRDKPDVDGFTSQV